MWSVCGIYTKGRCHRGDSSCCWQQAPFVVIFRAGNIALRYFLLTFIFFPRGRRRLTILFEYNTLYHQSSFYQQQSKHPWNKEQNVSNNADSYLDAQTSKGVKEGVGVGRVGKLQH